MRARPRTEALLAAAAALLLTLPAASLAAARAPAWTLKTPEGETVSYPADAQGQPTVLLFWPSWCPYSRALQPYVQDIWEDYRDRGVKLWTINIKERGDPVATMRERGLSFPLLLDGDALIDRYGIERTPWFLVADGQQRIVYLRPADPPSPIDVARDARTALNRLLGERAVPLPETWAPPYDLHLREARPSRLLSDAADNAEWLPWADYYLANVDAQQTVADVAPRGALADGRAAIAAARTVWTEVYGAEQAANQAPFRAFRRGQLWLVAGRAYAGRLGEGFITVLHAEDGRVVQLRESAP
ncbi:MAG: peroxiredoxin family protein [Sinimarinibacterium flocculans]|uniref:peroxiredoxin family protein n=1 Tax=Sinimarinibacterium flocculans TaxID=985250 RepID=UPI003C56A353